MFVSLCFYSWGGIHYTAILLCSIVLNWIGGILIEQATDLKKIFLTVAILANLLILIYFKYVNFFIDNFNILVSIFNIDPIIVKHVVLPIGISFYTFQGISYVIDVYRGTVLAQRNILTLSTYITMFPQLIAGPIVRYKDIQQQLDKRIISIDNFFDGIKRFLLGLMRKVLIANQLASVTDLIFDQNPETLSMTVAWLGIVCYTLQIYYDFAGYSDMAIGLGKMFGFSFPENFNFPYISKSIKEFWRRWHMTLSAWFKDYLYIPLGGNRCGSRRLFCNLYVVFFCTGFWHGANWNFIIWGLLHGTFLVLERGKFGELIKKTPQIIQHCYTLFIVMIAWVFFRADNLHLALEYLQSMFGLQTYTVEIPALWEYATIPNILILLIALIGSTEIISKPIAEIICLCEKRKSLFFAYSIVIGLSVFIILTVATTYLVVGGYNPFIYFRF